MKKIIFGAMITLTFMSLLYFGVSANEWGEYKDYGYYVLDDGTIEIDSYIGSDDNIEIPEVIEGKKVTRIGRGAFSHEYSIVRVILPNSITEIDNSAFAYCENLTSIKIPNSVKSIGEYAFDACSSLTSITIPDSVTYIGLEAFNRTAYYDNEANWKKGVMYIGNHLIKVQEGRAGEFRIKDGTLTIAGGAFFNCRNLTDIIIPNSVKSIGQQGVYNCDKLTSIIIPDSVCILGDFSFALCENLQRVKIGDGITNINRGAFLGCYGLTDVNFGNSIKVIEREAFDTCTKLSSVFLPDSVEFIGDLAFGYLWSGGEGLPEKKTPFKIISYVGSEAERYAKENDIEFVAIDKHQYVFKIMKEATCKTEGLKKSICSICGDVAEMSIERIPHIYDNEEDGICNVCGEERHIHFYSSKITETATCITKGIKTYTCTCGDTYTEGIKATGKHTYSNACDAECNICGATRTPAAHNGGKANCKVKAVCKFCGASYGSFASHTYSNACDGECNICRVTRTPSAHKYSNACDKSCDICKATRSITHSYKSTTTKATLSKNGKIETKCTVCGDISKTTTIYYPKTIKLSATSYTYNGKTKTPSVTVKDSKGKTLKKGTDYTVTYPKKRKSIGKYTATVTFKGNYSGTKKLTFEIVPKKVTLSKLTAGKKQLTATWKTVSGATGYEVTYSTSKKFTKKTTKTVTIKNAKTTKTTIKKLKKGKKYYVKVRAYKTVSGKKIYGAYSSVKSVKVK